MSPSPASITEWTKIVIERMPSLSKPQATVLALWSYGIVLTRSCGLDTIAFFLAKLLGKKKESIRQRLKGWYKEKEKKGRQGKNRQELNVSASFPDVLRWVLSSWKADEKRLALAMDATSLGDRFVVLAVCVVYRGCSIPVAWKVLAGNTPGAWRPHWEDLFKGLKHSIPEDWLVIVLADRGLYARWLYETIRELHWHPFLRINLGGLCRVTATSEYTPIKALIAQVGQQWVGSVICFKSKPIACTLLAAWTAPHLTPWIVLTDLPPDQTSIAWYALRAWVEAGFKDTKRGGWQWQYSRIENPDRAQRFWLALAIASLWSVGVGSQNDDTPFSSSLPDLSLDASLALPRSAKRRMSCFRLGFLVILAALINGLPLPVISFDNPDPWPSGFQKTYP